MIKFLTIGILLYLLYRLIIAPSQKIDKTGEPEDSDTIDIDYEELE